MSGLADAADVERFKAAVAGRLGLQFDDGKLGFLGEVLQRRLGRRCASDYLSGLEDSPSTDEIGALARELTVGETYFFRNNEQFRALADVALPELMGAAPPRFLSRPRQRIALEARTPNRSPLGGRKARVRWRPPHAGEDQRIKLWPYMPASSASTQFESEPR